MKRLLILGAMVAAAAVLAACGSSSGGSGSATAATPSSSGQTVSVANISGTGRVLVDSSGQALYASNLEKSGKVMCMQGCTSFWKPLTVNGSPSGSGVSGLGTVKRPDDGAMQVTYKGMPLYSFTQEGANEVTGNGFQDAFNGQQFTWHVVSVSGSGSTNGSGSTSGSGGAVTY